MRITREENYIVIKISEKGKRSEFFYDLSGIPFHKWFDENRVGYDISVFSEVTVAKHVRMIISAARSNQIPISEDVLKLGEEYAALLEELNARERQKKEEAEKLKRAQQRVQYGCGWCEDLKWDKTGVPFCQHCAQRCETDDNEIERLFEQYKYNKAFNLPLKGLRPTAYPARGCKFTEEARKLFYKFYNNMEVVKNGI